MKTLYKLMLIDFRINDINNNIIRNSDNTVYWKEWFKARDGVK